MPEADYALSRFYQQQVKGRNVLLVDDVRNTGTRCRDAQAAVRAAGGALVATAEIYDRLEAVVDLDVPNTALAEYKAPENFPVGACPLCAAGTPVTTF